MLSGPAFVVMVLVTAYPLLYAVVLSLYNYRLTDPGGREFVGFSNYATVLGGSGVVDGFQYHADDHGGQRVGELVWGSGSRL